ncbi:hypothetical protein I3843_08G143600 [Carya illinoinensis]|nr:hypothetical protein I3843_08G143600 [Carya illinoinensis]
MPYRNTVSLNSMIADYAQHGIETESLHLFQQMLETDVVPTNITFISVLSACARTGKVEESQSYFNIMKENFGIELEAEHYSCMIDLLSPLAPLVGLHYSLPIVHTQMIKEIHEYLEEMSCKMKLAGYVPDVRWALVKNDETVQGEKEIRLGHPSEKLAWDCHNAIEVISAISGRDITVRDSHRFHCFKEGRGSCGDYW